MGKARDLARLGVSSSGVLADANAPSGSVIQVVQTMANGDQTIAPTGSQSNWTAVPGVNATITPLSASNRILVICSFKCCATNGAGATGNPYWGGRMTFSIAGGSYSAVPPVGGAKSGSVQAHFNISPDRTDGSQYRMTSANSIHLLHSPNTTSAITYRLEVAGFLENLQFGSPNHGAGDDDYWTEPYGITLLEIAV